MRKNLAALSLYKMGGVQKIQEQHHVTKKKGTANKLRTRQSKIFEKKQNSLDLSGM